MLTSPDFRELLSLLEKYKVRYLVVGGYAVMKYTEPRFTKDLDIWISTDKKNSKAVYTARGLYILLEMLRRYVMGSAVGSRQRLDDIGFDPIQFFIGLFDIYGQVPDDGGHLDGVDGKDGRIEVPHRGFNEQLASQQGSSIDAHGTGSTLAVLA